MRHNQNGRRFRGRGNNNGGGQSHHHNQGNQNHGQRRVNPRVQTFDSNGPEVRIRGNAAQINEKYLALAKDAASAGDRILAESYLQHAEHYQRLINEMTEEYNRYQAQHQQHNGGQHQHHNHHQGHDDQPAVDAADAEQPVIDAPMPDLDQGFLVGPRKRGGAAAAAAAEDETPAVAVERPARAAKAAVDNG